MHQISRLMGVACQSISKIETISKQTIRSLCPQCLLFRGSTVYFKIFQCKTHWTFCCQTECQKHTSLDQGSFQFFNVACKKGSWWIWRRGWNELAVHVYIAKRACVTPKVIYIYTPSNVSLATNFQLFLSSLSSQNYTCYLCACTPLDHSNDVAPSIIEYAMKLGELGMTLRYIMSISLLYLTTSFVPINSKYRSVWALCYSLLQHDMLTYQTGS